MDPKWEKNLRHQLPAVVEVLQPKMVVDPLYAVRLLTKNDYEELAQSRDSQQVKARRLLIMLQRRGPESFDKFCDVLMRVDGQQFVERMLRPNRDRSNDPPPPPVVPPSRSIAGSVGEGSGDSSLAESLHETGDGSAGHLAIVVEGGVSPEVNKQIMQTAREVAIHGMNTKGVPIKAVAKRGSAGSVAVVYRPGTHVKGEKTVSSPSAAATVAPVKGTGTLSEIHPTRTQTSGSDAPITNSPIHQIMETNDGSNSTESSDFNESSRRQTGIAGEHQSIPQSCSDESHDWWGSFISSHAESRVDQTPSSNRGLQSRDVRHEFDSGSVHRGYNQPTSNFEVPHPAGQLHHVEPMPGKVTKQLIAVVSRVGRVWWKEIGVELGFSGDDLGHYVNINGDEDRARRIITDWISRNGRQATRDQLMSACEHVGIDVAVELELDQVT